VTDRVNMQLLRRIERDLAEVLPDKFLVSTAGPDEAEDIRIVFERKSLPELHVRICSRSGNLERTVSDFHARVFKTHVRHLSAGKHIPVLAATAFSAGERRRLRDEGISFIDARGEIFLRGRGLLVDRKISDQKERSASLGGELGELNLDRIKASRIIRVLLTFPEREWRLSEIAQASTVSVMYASVIFRRLISAGFATRKRPRAPLRLLSPGGLLEAWAEANTPPLKSAIRFVVPGAQEIHRLLAGRERGAGYAFTLFAGANLLGIEHVRSNLLHIYYLGPTSPLEQAFGPPHDSGNLVVMAPRDPSILENPHTPKDGAYPVAPPIQIYADLLTVEPRGREAAEELRRRVIKF
jgi:hypothetical protein